VIAAIVLVVLILAVGGWLWFQASIQSQEHDRALAQSVADARRKDVELREAIRTLQPILADARGIHPRGVEVLGSEAAEVTALESALAVADLLVARVRGNPEEVAEAMGEAEKALRQDQDQLALVEPVRTNLTAAVEAIERAIERKELEQAIAGLTAATVEVNAAVDAATATVDVVSARIAELTASLPAPPAAPGVETPGTPAGTTPALPPPSSASPSPDGSDEPTEEELAEELDRQKEVQREINALNGTVNTLNIEITRARSLVATAVDQDDIDAVSQAASARKAAASQIREADARVRDEHADLFGDPSEPSLTPDAG
jgi:chromosome segregation ATPase